MWETLAQVQMRAAHLDENSFYLPLLQAISKECLNIGDSHWEGEGNLQFEDKKNGYRIDLNAYSMMKGTDLMRGCRKLSCENRISK